MESIYKMLNMKFFILVLLSTFFIKCQAQNKVLVEEHNQEKIINKYLKNGAWNHHYLTKEWEAWIDKGIAEDSTIAYLWQQKALPYWKQKKYQLAISFYNKAVYLDRQQWLSRLAFLKCIFAKDYEGALIDLNTYVKEYGTTIEQDHSLEFYMGICYLQINNYDLALSVLKENVSSQAKKHGVNWVPFLDRFYLAIAYYEKGDYNLAISELNIVLNEYSNFSDAQFYKSVCLNYLGQKKMAKEIMARGKSNFEMGYTFNEDSNLYENYPYQVTWQWKITNSLLK